MPSLNLKGPQLKQFSDALRDAFPLQRLREVLKFRLDKRVDDYSLGADYQEIVFDLLTAAEAEGWTAELLVAARQSNPGNAALQALAQEVGLGATTPALERIIREKAPYLDVELFRHRLAELEHQVCRIEIETPRGTVYGTGFLVAPNLVMTNHHVMEQVISGKVAPTACTLRFGYKRTAAATVSPGVAVPLAPDWLVDASPPSAIDLKPEPKPGVPAADELDYALIRASGEPGNEPPGGGADPKAPARGWIRLADVEPPTADSPVLILQHPDSAPLKLALDMSGVIGDNGNGTRLRYRVNTEGGSSGAPVFNTDWQLVALHHSGDPNFDVDHKPTYNEGIPVGAILKLLAERGKRAELGRVAMQTTERIVEFTAGDGFRCNLIHVSGERPPSKGPVMLVHGAGVRANIFRAPVQTTIVDYLVAHGYDVWLENWRASIDFEPNKWTLDQAALFDHPAAVQTVVRETGASEVKAIIHCQGSTSFMMSAVAGLVPQVSTIVSNAVALHTVIPEDAGKKLKYATPMIGRMTDYLNPQWGRSAPTAAARLVRMMVNLTHHECDNGVCKHASFVYGAGHPTLWRHENLNEQTHAWLSDEFAEVPLVFFEQMARCVERGHLVSTGEYRQLPDDFVASAPMTDARFAFIAGELNECFLAESQKRTFAYFDRLHPAFHSLRLFPAYGHLDVFMGQRAAQDTFPIILEELERSR